ncbi:GAF domain-containing protein [Pseudarthrobacter sp. LT1]|uniref:GAF domain-containing protein n=1 Tax=Pseudarthrobacter sp. LT1 TaxID=3111450 RepID=UPI002D767B27|nr:GAF domain-containing protein [Pseudarthrobacter sp. LT1]WRT14122.1 GAF domain-containing protein [Pseudarthrobacter sp. LT1]
MAADPTGQVGWGPLPVTPEPVFDSKDVEDYLWEVTRDFMTGIKGERRGIGWAATLFRLGKARTLAASTEQAREADREQCSFADGPVMDAVRTGEFVLLSDLGRDRRWPGYSSAAAGHGVQSLLSVPILTEGATSAAITLYAASPHAFTSDDLMQSQSYVRQVSRALRVVVRTAERAEATAGLAVVQSSLVLVDLAVRSLMNEYGLTREGALRFLQTQALHHEVDLRDAALNVVAPGGVDRGGGQVPGRRQETFDGVAELPLPSAAGRDFPTGKSPRKEAAAGKEPPPAAEGRTA